MTARKDEHNDSLDNRPPRGVSWVMLKYYQISFTILFLIAVRNHRTNGSVAQW